MTPEQVEQALEQDPEIRAVFLTTPNYFGLAAATRTIAEIAHRHGPCCWWTRPMDLIWGSRDQLPPGAMESGADAAAQSTHKILGAMTQCSLLQVRYDQISPEAWKVP